MLPTMIEWLLWLAAFGLTAVPVGGLLLDRLFNVPARRYAAAVGLPWLAATVAVAAYALATGSGVFPLLLWGAVGGIAGTFALDAVRLAGVRRGAFPVDMPVVFGLLLAGLAPALQRNMMARMVERTAVLPDDARRAAMGPRLAALARLGERRREMVVAGMVAGLGRLPEERRQAMLGTQLALLADLPAGERRAVLATMDRVLSADGFVPPYGQPRGMPRIPMATFREMAEVELPRTVREARRSLGHIALLGYLWHFVMGATFGAQYALLVGTGSWGLAIAWGIFVWLVMMIVMPSMMPMITFPRWFPIVPFLAHVAFALPLAWVALAFISPAATSGSLAGLLRLTVGS